MALVAPTTRPKPRHVSSEGTQLLDADVRAELEARSEEESAEILGALDNIEEG